MKSPQFQKGFTLIELVVVTAIFAIIALVIVQVFFVTTRSNTKTELVRDVKQNGDQALDVMTRFLQNAIAVSASSCPESTEPSVSLSTITITNLDGGKTMFTCDDSSGYPRIASSSSGKTFFLTNENVALFDTATETRTCDNTSLLFQCTSVGSVPSSVRIKYVLTQRVPNESEQKFMHAQEVFETSVTLRNK